MKLKYLFIVFFLVGFSCKSTKQNLLQDNPDYTIAFYNVENLFDIHDDPQKIDEEFMPTSEKKWNKKRYNKKLQDLADVLSAIDTTELPELIGLAEVENKSVLEDLVAVPKLAPGNYGIVHEESPDVRGIDVALLYRKNAFRYIEHHTLSVDYPAEEDFTTRDILHVKGHMPGKDTLHVFVNHWSSRRGGLAATQPKRVAAAKVVRKKLDEILTQNPDAKIVLMGDFNDEPDNKSLSEILNATDNKNSNNPLELYNLMYEKDKQNLGTYNYKGNWNMLDNIIVSQGFLHAKKGYDADFDSGNIFHKEWMTYTDPETEIKYPNRTYGGPNYYGGYSDHWPVYAKFSKIDQK